ncbi:MAG: S-methyl-5'-thioadenosine phosphorylase [Bacteroidales bacterium]|nr:S-methyl-5'-thioadenosine phosphorylase [Bacteroidales bacterium]
MMNLIEKPINNKIKKIGIIGGTGLERLNIFKDSKEITVDTPFGAPSSPLLCGKINGLEVVIISRHNKDHVITPTNVNNRANILALKKAGCTHIIATTACGSLKEEIHRGDIVILDQFIDFTRHRPITFFKEFKPGKLNHTPMADPFSKELRDILIDTSKELKLNFHPKGTVVTIEGPRFSTRAESNMFRAWGADVINMSIAPETILANEAGIPYAGIALSTDYDCWKIDEAPVSWPEILKVFNKNIHNVTNLIISVIKKIAEHQYSTSIN